MSRTPLPLAALALLAAIVPASAQEFGGVRPLGPPRPAPLAGQAYGAPATSQGCRLSQTNVVVGVNRATGAGSLAGQRVAGAAPAGPGCRPLVSTQIVAGVNLGLGAGSAAEQTVEASAPRGALATTTYARGVNVGAGTAAAARQRILTQTYP